MGIINRRQTGPLTDVRTISPNVSGNFLTATGVDDQIASITPATAGEILGGGSVGSLSLQSPNGDYYSIGVTNGGIMTAISQSFASNTVVLKAGDGTCYSMTVSNEGTITMTSSSC